MQGWPGGAPIGHVLLLKAQTGHGGPWPLRSRIGDAGADADVPVSRLSLARRRIAMGASCWLDPAADPDPGPSAQMRDVEASRNGPSFGLDL